jgi:hypothetical protein
VAPKARIPKAGVAVTDRKFAAIFAVCFVLALGLWVGLIYLAVESSGTTVSVTVEQEGPHR